MDCEFTMNSHFRIFLFHQEINTLIFLAALSIETPYNAVKVRLANMPCVSHAIQSIKKAKKANLPVVIACSDDPMIPENGLFFVCWFHLYAYMTCLYRIIFKLKMSFTPTVQGKPL